MSKEQAYIIAELSGLSSYESVLLFSKRLGDEGIEDLKLEIQKNFCCLSLKVFLRVILQNNKVLRRLKVSWASYINIPKLGGAIAEALKLDTMLTHLDLSLCNIDHNEAEVIAEALKVNRVLICLNLMNNDIGAEGAKAIAEALRKNKILKVLDIDGNKIGDEGAKAIASAFNVNTVLKHLNMDSNSVGSEGAKALAGGLDVNRALVVLELECNSIDPEGAKALAKALKVNGVLEFLNMARNAILPEGGKSIAELLKVNNAVTEVHISHPSVGSDAFHSIKNLLSFNSLNKAFYIKALCRGIKEGNNSEILRYLLDPENNKAPEGFRIPSLLKLERGTKKYTKAEVGEDVGILWLDTLDYVFGEELLPAEIKELLIEKIESKNMMFLLNSIMKDAKTNAAAILAEYDAKNSEDTKIVEEGDDGADDDDDRGYDSAEGEESESLEGESDKEQASRSSAEQSMFEVSDPSFELVRLEWFETKYNYIKPNSEEDEEMPEDSEYAEYRYSGYDLEKAPDSAIPMGSFVQPVSF